MEETARQVIYLHLTAGQQIVQNIMVIVALVFLTWSIGLAFQKND